MVEHITNEVFYGDQNSGAFLLRGKLVDEGGNLLQMTQTPMRVIVVETFMVKVLQTKCQLISL